MSGASRSVEVKEEGEERGKGKVEGRQSLTTVQALLL